MYLKNQNVTYIFNVIFVRAVKEGIFDNINDNGNIIVSRLSLFFYFLIFFFFLIFFYFLFSLYYWIYISVVTYYYELCSLYVSCT
jgi:hypothetical protein